MKRCHARVDVDAAESKMTSCVERLVGLGCVREWFQGDLVAEAFKLADESPAVAFGGLGVAPVEEFLAELVVGDALPEDVVGGGEDLVAGGDGGFGVAAAAFDGAPGIDVGGSPLGLVA
jgi:hypothetical protein